MGRGAGAEKVKALPVLGLLALTGCKSEPPENLPLPPEPPAVVKISDYCQVARRIVVDPDDVLTVRTEGVIVRHNAEWRRRCGRKL